MGRTYRFLLHLYPRKFRETFGEEMLRVFQEAAEEQRKRGPLAYAAFALRETLGLLLALPGAWLGGQPIRPLEMASEASGLPADVAQAQRCIDASIQGMVQAIAHHQFEKARFYSLAERKAREDMRRLKEAHGISD
ncbi:MAG TPA: hypothetical protein VMB25_04770 [Bryobacteraceae bacterium]|nr:hypothetical protein [Bryobacteraceae bacterium]